MNGERLRRRILFSVLYQSLFEMGLFTKKEGRTAVSAVLRLAQWHEPHPWYPPPYTGGRLRPSPKVQKLSAFGLIRVYSCLFVFIREIGGSEKNWSLHSGMILQRDLTQRRLPADQCLCSMQCFEHHPRVAGGHHQQGLGSTLRFAALLFPVLHRARTHADQ